MTNLRPFEIALHAVIFNFVFDNGMEEAVRNGKGMQYFEDKKVAVMFDKEVGKAFAPIGGVTANVVKDALSYAQSKPVNTAWLMFHKIVLLAVKFDGTTVGLFDKEVMFYLKHDQLISGNKALKPLAEHVASACAKVEKQYKRRKRFSTIFAKVIIPRPTEASITNLAETLNAM